MRADKLAIENMLAHYARILLETAGKRRGPQASSLKGAAAAVKAEAMILREERLAETQEEPEPEALFSGIQPDLLARFAGTWPPTDPLDMLAMWMTLLEDWDELSEYCDLKWDGPQRSLPAAWNDLHKMMLALEPTTVEAATAIFYAAKRDEEACALYEWDEAKVERAKRIALRSLPRPK